MAVVVMAAVVIMVVAGVVMVRAAGVVAPGKGFGENSEKSSPRRKGEFPLGLLM